MHFNAINGVIFFYFSPRKGWPRYLKILHLATYMLLQNSINQKHFGLTDILFFEPRLVSCVKQDNKHAKR